MLGFVLAAIPMSQPSRTALAAIGLALLGAVAQPAPAQGAAVQLYWVDQVRDRVERSNPDGSSIVTLASGLSGPAGIALDLAGEKIYFTDVNRIRRVDFDGSGLTDVVTGLTGGTQTSIDLDLAAGKIYWTDYLSGIWRANLDGSGKQNVYSWTGSEAIAVDPTGARCTSTARAASCAPTSTGRAPGLC